MSRAVCVTLLLLVFALTVAAQQGNAPAPSSSTADSAAPNPASDKQEPKESGSGHNWHFRLGTIGVGAGYFHGPGFYPYGPSSYYPYYSAALWDPFWNPYWGPYYAAYLPDIAHREGKGELLLTGAPKEAKVYIDGAYAGTADRLKHMWLDPGAYNLSVATPGRENFEQRIYILSGKTLKIAANEAPSAPDKEKP